MNTIILNASLSQDEIDRLIKQFPHYLFLAVTNDELRHIDEQQLKNVEIFFGSRLPSPLLEKMGQLRWVHSTHPQPLISNKIFIHKENLLLSYTPDYHARQTAEYIFAGILSFAKHLFHWRHEAAHPHLIFEAKWPQSIYSLKGQTLLIVGTDPGCIEAARVASFFDMKVWSADQTPSFHPHIRSSYHLHQLGAIAPQAKIVCLNFSHPDIQESNLSWLQKLPPDTLLILLGLTDHSSPDALYELLAPLQLRGIMIDLATGQHLSPKHKLWELKNLIVTPAISSLPQLEPEGAFKLFRYNLAQFQNGSFDEMHYLVRKGE